MRPRHAARVGVTASVFTLAASLVGCVGVGNPTSDAPIAQHAGLGSHRWPVSTTSSEAQHAFDEGVIWMYSFNHDEAIRSFQRAAAADPSCAMPWWGISLCHGPHINNPAMDEARARAAWDALCQARERVGAASPLERALIEALQHRYADPAAGPLPLDPAARAPWDQAYANAMASVHRSFPTHPDAGSLYAESLMDLRPWDLWTLDGTPRPDTPRIVAVLEGVLARDPLHPGANHLYIHAVEASSNPERADAAATRLRSLVPASGHMVHMPAHIDVRLGRWNLAADQNERAMAAHDAYVAKSPNQGFYRVYMLHNAHFLAYSCMMAGRSHDAIAAARGMIASIPETFVQDFAPIADAYMAIEVEALMRFGQWDAVLATPEPRSTLPITRAIWRFARGVSLAAKGDTSAARNEQRLFRDQVRAVPTGAIMAINPAEKVLSIAENMLEGEILYREGHLDAAVSRLRAAVEVEDTLLYMEPPDWVQPVRHALGAILLDAGRTEEAAEVYRQDLQRWPENGWSLYGMSRAMQLLGKPGESAEYARRYRAAFARADIQLQASCLCASPSTKRR